VIPNIFFVAIVIAVLIIIHEFGHLFAAKSVGIAVEKFSIGFGPALFKKKIRDTVYQLSLIPLGGYVKMFGEDAEVEGGFITQPAGKKIIAVLAGPVSNFILGFLLTLILYLSFGVKYVEPRINPEPSSWIEKSGLEKNDLILAINRDSIESFTQFEEKLSENLGETLNVKIERKGKIYSIPFWVESESLKIFPLVKPVVGRIKQGGPASRIGIKPGDEFLQIAEKPISDWEECVATIQNFPGKKILIKWKRNGQLLQDSVVPDLVTDEISGEKIGQLGIWVSLPVKSLSIFNAVKEAGERSVNVVIQTFIILYKIITGKISRRAIGGPIMVAKLTYEGINWGPEYFLALWGLLSINLFVVNLLPIPVLDGGRVLIFIIEAIRRKRLNKKQLEIALNVGWGLIFLLIFFTLFNDILRIVRP